ncbi:MAG: hypothetical protein M3Q52_10250, partial [Pseudomonadota bacterium]|nr:hypothetical protein [Pseudomonadota bacterium]
ANDPAGDFATVGDEDGGDHLLLLLRHDVEQDLAIAKPAVALQPRFQTIEINHALLGPNLRVLQRVIAAFDRRFRSVTQAKKDSIVHAAGLLI